MFEPAAYQLSVGCLTPWPAPITNGLWARLIVDAAIPLLVVTIARPSQSDVGLVVVGSIDVALDQEGTSAVLLWRLSCAGMPTIDFDTPLHFGLERVREFPGFSTRDLAPGDRRGAAVLLQDETGIARVIRPIVMPRPILDGLAPLLVKQLASRRVHRVVGFIHF